MKWKYPGEGNISVLPDDSTMEFIMSGYGKSEEEKIMTEKEQKEQDKLIDDYEDSVRS